MPDRPTRFVLLGHARVGSNVLADGLNQHPEIAMLGEVLSETERVRRESGRRRTPYQTGWDGASYLDEKIFPKCAPEGTRACGFKLFYDHGRFDDHSRTAWDYLVRERDIRVVHLNRQDWLASLISLKVALITGEWSRAVDSHALPSSADPFRLDPRECHEYFDRIARWRKWAGEALAGHPILPVGYENDTCRDFPGTMARIFEFLGVAPFEATASLRKQQTRPPAEQIINLNELREYFRHTPYEDLIPAGRALATRRAPAPRPTPPRRWTVWKRGQRPTRFVLLCHERSGSNLVLWGLGKRRGIAILNEALSELEQVRRDCAEGNRHRALYEPGRDGATFLDEQVFLPTRRGGIRATGVKLFYHHARFDACVRSVWDYILEDRDIRIIHLIRRNVLDCWISHEVALRTGEWFHRAGSRTPPRRTEPFSLDPQECHAYFDRIVTWQWWADSAFAGHPVLKIEYERDVCDRFQPTMARVFQFLGLAPKRAAITLVRQQTQRPWEQISNYDDLRKHFRHTPYEQYFTCGSSSS